MRPGVAVRLALAGTRTDTLRVALTGVSAALASVAMLSAAAVLSIRTPPGGHHALRYQSDLLQQPGLRPGVAGALMLLCLPVLALAAQCTRLGAPARDHRLAAIRLAGATPAQTLAVVTVEVGLASLIGTLVGLAVFLGGRVALDRRNADGELWLPTDVLPPAWAVTAICASLPVIAMLFGALLLRRVRVTPFGTARQSTRVRTPRTWPAPVLVIGAGVVAGFGPLTSVLGSGARGSALYPALFAVSVGLAAGVVAGTSSISYVVGIVLRRWGRTPSTLLAGSRLMTDPWSGSRVLAALLAAVLIGGVSIGVRAQFAAQYAADVEADRLWVAAVGEPMMADPAANDFYLNAMDLVDLAIAVAVGIAAIALLVAAGESLVARRRTYASLVATGVPRGVIGRSVVWQLFAPAVPSVVIAAVVGWLTTRTIGHTVTSGGTTGTICLADGPICSDPVLGAPYLREVDLDLVVLPVPVPVAGLLLLTGGALLAILVTIAISMLFLRASTAIDELRTA